LIQQEAEAQRIALEDQRKKSEDMESILQLSERQRIEIENAKIEAEERRIAAEELASLEKEDREAKEAEALKNQQAIEEKEREAERNEELARQLKEEVEESRLKMEAYQKEMEDRLAAMQLAAAAQAQEQENKSLLSEEADDSTKEFADKAEVVVATEDDVVAVESNHEPVATEFTSNGILAHVNGGDEIENDSHEGDEIESDSHGGDEIENDSHGETDLTINEDEVIPRPEEERITQAEKSKRMQKQLKDLRQELSTSKDMKSVTKNDVLHQGNLSAGRDKYKTLKQIREGNTRYRVDLFESM